MHRYLKDPFPALSHAFGVVLAICGFAVLVHAAKDNSTALLGGSIYGATLVLLFLASSLAHSVRGTPKIAARLEQFDHAAIFLLIAGTYTPVCLLLIKGRLGLALLIGVWSIAIFGVVGLVSGRMRSKKHQVCIYLVMGWMCVCALGPISASSQANLLVWLVGGGVIYSVGSLVFLTHWPPLWRGCFSSHDVWHLMVLAASTCHFVMIKDLVQAAAA